MPVIEAQCASILVPHDHKQSTMSVPLYAFVQRYGSGCVWFEPHGAKVVSCGQAHVSV